MFGRPDADFRAHRNRRKSRLGKFNAGVERPIPLPSPFVPRRTLGGRMSQVLYQEAAQKRKEEAARANPKKCLFSGSGYEKIDYSYKAQKTAPYSTKYGFSSVEDHDVTGVYPMEDESKTKILGGKNMEPCYTSGPRLPLKDHNFLFKDCSKQLFKNYSTTTAITDSTKKCLSKQLSSWNVIQSPVSPKLSSYQFTKTHTRKLDDIESPVMPKLTTILPPTKKSDVKINVVPPDKSEEHHKSDDIPRKNCGDLKFKSSDMTNFNYPVTEESRSSEMPNFKYPITDGQKDSGNASGVVPNFRYPITGDLKDNDNGETMLTSFNCGVKGGQNSGNDVSNFNFPVKRGQNPGNDVSNFNFPVKGGQNPGNDVSNFNFPVKGGQNPGNDVSNFNFPVKGGQNPGNAVSNSNFPVKGGQNPGNDASNFNLQVNGRTNVCDLNPSNLCNPLPKPVLDSGKGETRDTTVGEVMTTYNKLPIVDQKMKRLAERQRKMSVSEFEFEKICQMRSEGSQSLLSDFCVNGKSDSEESDVGDAKEVKENIRQQEVTNNRGRRSISCNNVNGNGTRRSISCNNVNENGTRRSISSNNIVNEIGTRRSISSNNIVNGNGTRRSISSNNIVNENGPRRSISSNVVNEIGTRRSISNNIVNGNGTRRSISSNIMNENGVNHSKLKQPQSYASNVERNQQSNFNCNKNAAKESPAFVIHKREDSFISSDTFNEDSFNNCDTFLNNYESSTLIVDNDPNHIDATLTGVDNIDETLSNIQLNDVGETFLVQNNVTRKLGVGEKSCENNGGVSNNVNVEEDVGKTFVVQSNERVFKENGANVDRNKNFGDTFVIPNNTCRKVLLFDDKKFCQENEASILKATDKEIHNRSVDMGVDMLNESLDTTLRFVQNETLCENENDLEDTVLESGVKNGVKRSGGEEMNARRNLEGEMNAKGNLEGETNVNRMGKDRIDVKNAEVERKYMKNMETFDENISSQNCQNTASLDVINNEFSEKGQHHENFMTKLIEKHKLLTQKSETLSKSRKHVISQIKVLEETLIEQEEQFKELNSEFCDLLKEFGEVVSNNKQKGSDKVTVEKKNYDNVSKSVIVPFSVCKNTCDTPKSARRVRRNLVFSQLKSDFSCLKTPQPSTAKKLQESAANTTILTPQSMSVCIQDQVNQLFDS